MAHNHEVRGSNPRVAIVVVGKSTLGVVVTYFPSKEVPRFRLPEGAQKSEIYTKFIMGV